MTADQVTAAENCQNMDEVRRGVDAVDKALIDLLTNRFAYMRAAARIKTDRRQVRDEVRKQAVIDNAAQAAALAGIPVSVITEIWEILVEGSIEFELSAWDHKEIRVISS